MDLRKSGGMMARELSRKVSRLQASATEEVDNEVKRLRREGVDDLLSLAVGEPCFDTPDPIKRAAWEALNAGKTKYEPTAGDYALREAICGKLQQENGIDADPSNVVVTAGAKFSIYLAFQAILSPGERVILFDPAWVSYGPAAELAGASVTWVPTAEGEGFQPDLEALRAAMDSTVRIVVVNSPNNPTGAVYPEGTIREIVEIADEHGAFVLSDEIYEHLIYEGGHYSPRRDYANVITVNGFSKAYAMTGWRLGYAVAPPAVVEGMLKVYQHSTSCVTSFAQAGAVVALTDPACRRAVAGMIDGYRERRRAMTEAIRRSKHLSLATVPRGAFYTFPRYSGASSSLEVAKALLQECHVATVPGEAFGSSGDGHLRLAYATDVGSIDEAFARMERFFTDGRPGGRRS